MKKLHFIYTALLLLALLLPIFRTSTPIDASSLVYYRTFKVNPAQVPASNSDLTQFPVLVSLTADSGLISHASSSGTDIYFTDASDNALPYEIEKYDGSGNLVAWVQLPSLSNSSSSPTNFKMLYGGGSHSSPANVWTNGFQGVWHMSQPNYADSTTNGNNGTAVNGTVSNSSGKIDGADSFVNSPASGYIDCGTGSNLAFVATGSYTWSGWVDTTGAVGGGCGIIGRTSGSTGTAGFDVYLKNNGNAITIQQAGGSSATQVYSSNITSNVWHLITVTYNNQNVQMFLDGGLLSTTGVLSNMVNDNSDHIYIGYRASHSNGTGVMNGAIDEVRWANTARSADWIKAEYNNQSAPGTFLTVGDETQVPEGTLLSVPAVSGCYGGTMTISATLTSGGSAVSGKNINFTLNDSSMGTAATDSNGTATLNNISLSGISAGTYAGYIGASFAGDAGYSACRNSGALTVTRITSVFSGLTNSQSIDAGTASITLAGSLKNGSLIPSGEIAVTINGSAQTTSINQANGSFTLNFPTASLPTSQTPYAITYSYSGDTNFTAAADTSTTLTVNQVQAATSLVVSPVNGNYLGKVALTAVLSSKGTGLAGKSVIFTLNGTSVGTAVTDVSGIATLTDIILSTINPGNYSYGVSSGVGASFSGDSDYTACSGGNSLTVNKAPTSITVNAVTGTIGGSVTLTASLACNGSTLVSNQNNITFTLNGINVGNAIKTNSSGIASETVAIPGSIAGGIYISGVGVNFGGLTKYAASSGSNTLTINKQTVSFGSLSSPLINAGLSSVSFNGTLSNGGFYPSGEIVTISLNDVSQNATVSAGGAFSAVFNTGNLAQGIYPINYNYAGNAYFNPVSGNGSLTVKAAALNSYSDPECAAECESFASNENRVYLLGANFVPGDFRVDYFDASGTNRYSEIVSVNSTGILLSNYWLRKDKTAVAGTWKVLVQPSSASKEFGTDGYATIMANPRNYSLVAGNSFEVASTAIPELPVTVSGILVVSICGAVFYLKRRKFRIR